jgi:hypothetical protein
MILGLERQSRGAHIMRLLLVLSLAASAAAAPAAADGAFQVVRNGDAKLSCQALATETAALGEAVNAAQAKAEAKAKKAQTNRRLLGFAASAVSGALPAVAARGDSVVGYHVAQSAASAIQQQAQANAFGEAPGGLSQPIPEQARLDRLVALQSQKGC